MASYNGRPGGANSAPQSAIPFGELAEMAVSRLNSMFIAAGRSRPSQICQRGAYGMPELIHKEGIENL
jgi:hypothetical protein